MNTLNHWQVASIAIIVIAAAGLLLGCGSQPKPATTLSAGDDLLRAGCVVMLYQDQISKEVGEYSAFGIATDEDENGKERTRGVRCGKDVADVLAKLAADIQPFAATPPTTPHLSDGRWEVKKRWPNQYPFVLWEWTWPGRTNEPTVYIESPEDQPPEKPPAVIPSEPDQFAPGTRNNL